MSEAAVFAQVLIEALADAGVRDVVVSPGSRSTPLVLAAAATPSLRVHSVVDERVAAFFAVGQARVTGRPTAVMCTSGTAGAHFYPAVIEAAMAYVPLVVITADRPPELHSCAAPQTIDQQRLFGTYVRAFHDLGLPNEAPAALAAVRRRAAQAVFRATEPMPGPVHINVPARKPLEPDGRPVPSASTPMVVRPRRHLEPEALEGLVLRLENAERPLFVAGPAPATQRSATTALDRLATRLDAAVYAEATSQLRFNNPQPGDGLGVWLGSPTFAERFDPDLVVQLGAPATSGAWLRWREANRDVPYVAIAPYDWADPGQGADTWVVAHPSEVLPLLADRVTAKSGAAWRGRIAGWDRRAWQIVDRMATAATEGEAVRVVRQQLPADSVLILGNSLPVRHVDAFCASGGAPVDVLSQRGANGIDGLVAGAAGASSAGDRPVTLVLGDVSFTHDVGALAIAATARRPLVIVVLDNGGGRIFELLPAGRRFGDQPVFDHFTTPPQVDLQALAAAFGLCHVRLEGTYELAAALDSAYRLGSATVVQVKLPDHGARTIADAIRAELDESPPDDEEPR